MVVLAVYHLILAKILLIREEPNHVMLQRMFELVEKFLTVLQSLLLGLGCQLLVFSHFVGLVPQVLRHMSLYQGLRHLHVFGNRMHQLAQIFFNGIFNLVYKFGSSEVVRPSLVIGSFCHSFVITSRLLELISDLPPPRGHQVKELCNGDNVMSGANSKQPTFPFPFLWKDEFFF